MSSATVTQRIAAKLREALGMDDVDDFLAALQSLPKGELAAYLRNVLADEAAAVEIASLMGAPDASPPAAAAPAPASLPPGGGGFYKKTDLDEEDKWAVGRGKKKGSGGGEKGGGGAPSATPAKAARALVGGASVSHAKPSAKEKRKGASSGTSSLDSLNSALRPGRHPCSCNARRHALITNCAPLRTRNPRRWWRPWIRLLASDGVCSLVGAAQVSRAGR
jgi:hypothetical protein